MSAFEEPIDCVDSRPEDLGCAFAARHNLDCVDIDCLDSRLEDSGCMFATRHDLDPVDVELDHRDTDQFVLSQAVADIGHQTVQVVAARYSLHRAGNTLGSKVAAAIAGPGTSGTE